MRRRWMEVSKQKAASKKQKQAAEGDVDMDSIDPFDASAVRRGALDPYLKMLDFDETAPMLDDVMPLHIQVEGKDRHVGARVAEVGCIPLLITLLQSMMVLLFCSSHAGFGFPRCSY